MFPADGCHWVYRMPEFNFKKNGVTKPAADKDDKDKKATTTTAASPTKSSFSRNVGKYATMPTKRSCEPINCDTGHHSDGEHEDAELSSDEEDIVSNGDATSISLLTTGPLDNSSPGSLTYLTMLSGAMFSLP